MAVAGHDQENHDAQPEMAGRNQVQTEMAESDHDRAGSGDEAIILCNDERDSTFAVSDVAMAPKTAYYHGLVTHAIDDIAAAHRDCPHAVACLNSPYDPPTFVIDRGLEGAPTKGERQDQDTTTLTPGGRSKRADSDASSDIFVDITSILELPKPRKAKTGIKLPRRMKNMVGAWPEVCDTDYEASDEASTGSDDENSNL